jgi:hypothetical protein
MPGVITYAETAKDCKLKEGNLSPINGDSDIESGHAGEIVKYQGAWLSSVESPVLYSFGNRDVLIYKDGGVWKKKVDGTAGSLGITRPAQPTLANLSLPKCGSFTIGYNANASSRLPRFDSAYYAAWIQVIEGKDVESELSEPVIADEYLEGDAARENEVFRPINVPSGATKWILYRSDYGDAPRKIGEGDALDVTGETIVDTLSINSRGVEVNQEVAGDGDQYVFSYLISWCRNVGGMLDESGPSDPLSITQKSVGVRITSPGGAPANATSWKIYRISQDFNPTSEYQLVAEVDIADTSYDDFIFNEGLGGVIDSYYEAADGTLVIHDEPSVVFDGICPSHYGMIFGWKDSILYSCEPGKIDVWPEFYQWDAKANIVTVARNGSELAIVTEEGLQRGIGSSPESFYIVEGGSRDRGNNRRSIVETEIGVFYLSSTGLVLANGSQSRNITREVLGDDYFQGINLSTAFLDFHNGEVYIFHDAGVIEYDTDQNKYKVLSGIYVSSWRDLENSRLAVLDGAGMIKSLKTDSGSSVAYDYKTGKISFASTKRKKVDSFVFLGDGTVTCTIYRDGTSIATKALDLNGLRRERRIRLPRTAVGKEFNIRLQGKAEIRGINPEMYYAEA